MRLQSRSARPPTGWVYAQAETGFEMQAGTLEQLVDVVIQHRLGNALPNSDRDTVTSDIENYICEQLRGTKALWQFCQTRMAMPPPAPRAAALAGTWVETAVPTAPLQSHGRRKTCPTCGGR